MLERTRLPLYVFGILGIMLTFCFSGMIPKYVFIMMVAISLVATFLGISFVAIRAKESNQKKYKAVFLIVSLALLAASLFSAYFSLTGSSVEGTLAVFCYCFAYAPLELHLKNVKWRAYSNNAWEMFLLSALDFLAVNLVLLGVLGIILNWPGQYYFIYTGAALLLVGLVLWNARFKQEVIHRKESEEKIKMQYLQIEEEKKVSDNLLLNILPAEVAEELKSKGSTNAKLFDDVTVLFTDFESFTAVSERLTPQQLVDELHTCFSMFDRIMTKYNIEKIKTVGDAYLAVCGLPLATSDHAVNVVKAAIEIRDFIKNRQTEKGKDSFSIRIGIHSGSVVAGIVGIKKFAYDIWGDTVNTAARMEQGSESGKINISETTYDLVKDKFVCEYRGEIDAKNKGRLKMYFVN